MVNIQSPTADIRRGKKKKKKKKQHENIMVCPITKGDHNEVLVWLFVWNEVQMICIWSRWCYCHLIIFSFIKIRIGGDEVVIRLQ